MIKRALCILPLFLVGCDDAPKYRTYHELEHVCAADTVPARAEFTLQCIANANPKSDEEPEDWIRLCLEMAVDTYCELQSYKVTEVKLKGGYWEASSRKLIKGGND
ncbi:MAG: hypothetical protein GY774_36240 [Planctomycetes bacterium]|nr:hypothetical protein [Planctomycetota bacterium]